MADTHDLLVTPTRRSGLDQLQRFVETSASKYAKRRNVDLVEDGHPYVSQLSPYLRHRMVTEPEVIAASLAKYKLSTVEKFVQEVLWRTYSKGWLEMRPGVWSQYQHDVRRCLDRVDSEEGLRDRWEAACRGETGIACFDHWAGELTRTGYMHNHARMWFASIWTYTLQLPWELGADFFQRHLLDGDPASNTLGWRWVVGLHTPGKTYLARASNIAKLTEGRFNPEGELAAEAPALERPKNPKRSAPPEGKKADPDAVTGYLLTEDDLCPGFAMAGLPEGPLAVMTSEAGRSPLQVSGHVRAFTDQAAWDAIDRLAPKDGALHVSGDDRVAQVVDWAREAGLAQMVTPFAPVGPGRDALDAVKAQLADHGITVVQPMREFDAMAWPHATAGFFKFYKATDDIIDQIDQLAR